jgi:hypothetical protein
MIWMLCLRHILAYIWYMVHGCCGTCLGISFIHDIMAHGLMHILLMLGICLGDVLGDIGI